MDITAKDLDNIVQVKEIIQLLDDEINKFEKLQPYLDNFELGALDELRRFKRLVEKMKNGVN